MHSCISDFSIDSVGNFEEDVERLMNNKGIVRNQAKIVATINNAKQFQIIIRKWVIPELPR